MGSCQNYTEKWYYDTREERCRLFYYGGCDGNENRFDEEDACISKCDKKIKELEPFQLQHCFLSPDTGPCHKDVPRWHYNAHDGTCSQFTFGGCGGNQNNFDSSEACASACEESQNPCSLPPVYGGCGSNITRWHFDDRIAQCLEFSYSGCHGNKNNYHTLKQCNEKCGSEPHVTNAPEAHLPDTASVCLFLYFGC